jgi:hypothetical protein
MRSDLMASLARVSGATPDAPLHVVIGMDATDLTPKVCMKRARDGSIKTTGHHERWVIGRLGECKGILGLCMLGAVVHELVQRTAGSALHG